jgi:hypothetical protein
MSLIPLISADEIRGAFELFFEHVKKGARLFRRNVGWRGKRGEDTYDVYWRSAESFWVLLHTPSPSLAQSQYWCAFGKEDPHSEKTLTITCEINPPTKGINRRCAGIFLKNSLGQIYIAHSGKIGGGRKGIGKSGFFDHYRWDDNCKTINWPDGKKTKAVVIGRIDGKRLPDQLAHFVEEVERIKLRLSRG